MWTLLFACAGQPEVDPEDTSSLDEDSAEQIGDDTAEDTGGRPDCGEVPADDAAYAALFDPALVHEVELTLDEDDAAALAVDPRGWVEADVQLDGAALPGVGVRWRGPSEQQRWDGKPGFKVDFREMGRCDTVAGLEGVTLDGQAEDPAMGRWVVTAAVFEAAGLPTPRAVHATLAVNGEDFGLYALVETVDGAFAARRWPGGGVLWEGGEGADFGAGGLDDWDDVGGGGDEAALEAVAAVVQGAGDDFYAQAEGLVDMEQFLATWGALAAVGHADAYPYEPDHVYLFAPTDDPRFVFVPWATDAGWDPTFGWDHVEGQLGLRCVYDPTCEAAALAAVEAALLQVEALDVPALAAEAFAVSADAVAAEARHPTAPAAVLVAREALLVTMAAWPQTVRVQTE